MDWNDAANVIAECQPLKFQALTEGECRFRRTLVTVHLALLFHNLAWRRMKFWGAPVITFSMNKSSSHSLPEKWYQKNKGLVSKSGRFIENTQLVLSSSRLSPDRRLFVVQLPPRHARDI
jgi:hypothetical protein